MSELAGLEKARRLVESRVKNGKPGRDPRGAELFTWSGRSKNERESEYSVEHEVLLRATTDAAIGRLLRSLLLSESMEVGNLLDAPESRIGSMAVSRFQRRPGIQSRDTYFDTRETGFIDVGYSLRERTVASDFMTWAPGAAESAELTPFNAQIPNFDIATKLGIVARLEFNWFDSAKHWTSSPVEADHPISLLASIAGADWSPDKFFAAYVVETLRLKFGLFNERSGADTEVRGSARLVVNLDFITAYRPSSPQERVRWVDVDASSQRPIDPEGIELGLVSDFSRLLVETFECKPASKTKCQSAAENL